MHTQTHPTWRMAEPSRTDRASTYLALCRVLLRCRKRLSGENVPRRRGLRRRIMQTHFATIGRCSSFGSRICRDTANGEGTMPITGKGWELLVTRLGIHKSGSKQRTYSTY